MIKVVDPGSKTWNYSYNGFGNLTSVDAPGTAGDRSYGYSSAGFLTSETSPERGTISFGRDAVGNMTSRSDSLGTINYTYDAGNRLTNINYAGSSYDATLIYDQADNRTGASNSYVKNVYTYDGNNRLAKKDTTFLEISKTVSVSYTYGDGMNLTKITYPSTRYATYNYNSGNQVTSVTGTVTYASSVGYSAAGPMTSITYGNGVAMSIGLDSRYRIKSIKSPSSSGTILNLTYGYTGENVTGITDVRDSSKSMTFGYDNRDRMTSASATGLWGSLTFAYDDLGNRTSETRTGLSTSVTYNYTSNRLTSTTGGRAATYAYDTNGRMNSRTISGATCGFTWAGDSYLTQTSVSGGSTTSYAYDPDGLRVRSTNSSGTSYYVHDLFGNILAEYNSSGTLTEEHVYVNSFCIARFVGTTPTYLHFDALGTPLAHTNSSASVIWRGAYEPFGSEAYASTTTTENQKFAGKELDTDISLYYFGARYHDPLIGRFVSVDKVVGDPAIPQGLNRYSYSVNNPIRYSDPSGNIFDTVLDVIGVAIDIHAIYTEGATTENLVMLGADLAGALIPGLPSPGAMKLGKRALEAAGEAKVGSEMVKGAARSLENAGEALAEHGFCFVAGTLVWTEDGLKPIEQVKVGERVRSQGALNDESDWRMVTQLFITPDQPVLKLHLEVADGRIEPLGVTAAHPFWVEDRGWTAAGKLVPGDRVFTRESGWVRVSGATWHPARKTVYNFEVEGFHSYFVGETGVWVHNASCMMGEKAAGVASAALKDGDSLPTGQALEAALDFLGPGYKEIAPGVFKSADGKRLVRMTDSDLARINNHNGNPHMNFETGESRIKSIEKRRLIPPTTGTSFCRRRSDGDARSL